MFVASCLFDIVLSSKTACTLFLKKKCHFLPFPLGNVFFELKPLTLLL